MATWKGLRDVLASADGPVTLTWEDIEALVGKLPPSATAHRAFWSGPRPAWSGFSVTGVRPGGSVTFSPRARGDRDSSSVSANASHPDVVLIGCVKSKQSNGAPAKDLYISPLFRKEREYAERSGARWFILSAEHGLVDPQTVLEPYDRQLSKTSLEYRREWGQRVVEQLEHEVGRLAGKLIEVRPGEAYATAIRDRLQDAGAEVREPMRACRWGAGSRGTPPPQLACRR